MGYFNSKRLKDARKFRRLTLDDLAIKIGTSRQAISQYENGTEPQSIEITKKISDALGFPISFFLEADNVRDVQFGSTQFRSLFTATKKDLNSLEIKARYLARIQYELREYIQFPELNLPEMKTVIMPNTDIERVSSMLRDYWSLGEEPIPDMVSLLERNGIIVSELATDVKSVDAFSQYNVIDGIGYFCVILGTDKNCFVRRQFDCAHELAHIILHNPFQDNDDLTREEYHNMETEANKFASAFLLPKNAFSSDIAKFGFRLNVFIELKKKWKVSISSMIMRARDLEIINTNQFQYLIRTISAKGWKKDEPLDDILEVRHPKFLKKAISLLLFNDVLTGKEIVDLFAKSGCSLSKNVIEELLGLEPDVLLYDEGKVIQFPRLRQ